MTIARACPKCEQSAPIVLRGSEAFCTVCGAPRAPFAADILNLAGKPAQLGGYAARFFGWGAMGLGLFVALTLGLVVQAVASMFVAGSWLGLAVAVPIALVSLALGLLGIVGGRKLGRAGESRLLEVQRDTIRGLARHNRGIVKPRDAARALGIDEARADALLGALARVPEENVSLDVDDDGVVYLFGSADAIRWRIRAERAGLTEVGLGDLERELERAAAQAGSAAPPSTRRSP